MILVCDVGGTKIDLGFVHETRGSHKSTAPIEFIHRRSFVARECKDFVQLLRKQVTIAQTKVERISLAVAGPVSGARRIQLTNLPWAIDLDQIAGEFPGATVHVANDLEALAAGVTGLEAGELTTLHKGVSLNGNRCVIAAGTGLGEALLIWDDKSHRAVACEGGHGDFGPNSDEDMALWHFANARFGHVSWERLVSGVFGFPTLIAFYISLGQTPSHELLTELKASPDSTGEALARYADQGEPFAVAVISKFVCLYGAEAGNLALKAMAVGGVYVGGGIAPKLLNWMKKPELFRRAFCAKGRFAAFMEMIPVHVITSDRAILLGAAIKANEASSSGEPC